MDNRTLPPTRPESARSTVLDLARLALAILVILSHSFGLTAPGGVEPSPFGHSLGEWAVRGFFVLSGYLIAASWLADPDVGRFAARRFFRIVPAYLVAFIASVGVGMLFGGIAHPVELLAYAALLFPPAMAAFPGSRYAFVNGPMWTIHWEAICYVIAPLVLLSLGRGWRLVALTVVAAVTMHIFFSGHEEAAFLFCFLLGAVASATFRLRVPDLGLRRLPDVSYGVYLYGWPIQKVLGAWGVANAWALFLLTLPIALGLGYASHRWLEKPAMAFGRRLTRPRPTLIAPAATVG